MPPHVDEIGRRYGRWAWVSPHVPGGGDTPGGPDGAPAPGATDPAVGPAVYAMNRLLAWCAAGMRAAVALVAGIAALIGIAPPASMTWVLPVVIVNGVWVAVFVHVAVRYGLRTWLVAGDVALTVAMCVGQVYLVAPVARTTGVGWVSVIASISIVAASLHWRLPAGMTAGALVIAGYLLGSRLAGTPDNGMSQAVIYVVQIGSMVAIMALLRRAAVAADAALVDYHATRRRALADQARRAAEREHNRRLHDTVLATLTIVGTGAIARRSVVVRQRAAADLSVLLDSAAPPAAPVPAATAILSAGWQPATRSAAGAQALLAAHRTQHRTQHSPAPSTPSPDPPQPAGQPHGGVRLDLRLGEAVARSGAGLTVEFAGSRCTVPAPVSAAFLGAATQALQNVARHAGVAGASVQLWQADGMVLVDIVDRGRGFDPAAVPAYRYGLRESTIGRMRAVGGQVRVWSAAGRGTRIRLIWPAPPVAGGWR